MMYEETNTYLVWNDYKNKETFFYTRRLSRYTPLKDIFGPGKVRRIPACDVSKRIFVVLKEHSILK